MGDEFVRTPRGGVRPPGAGGGWRSWASGTSLAMLRYPSPKLVGAPSATTLATSDDGGDGDRQLGRDAATIIAAPIRPICNGFLCFSTRAGAVFCMEMKNVVGGSPPWLVAWRAVEPFRTALIELSHAAQTGSGQVGAALKGWSAETEGLTGAVDRLNAAGVDGASVIQEMGARAGPGMAALLKIGGDAMRDLSDKVTQNSDVAKMYETQMGTLSGQFTLLKASIEELAVKLFSKLPRVHEIIDGAKNFVSSIGGLRVIWYRGTVIEGSCPC